MSDPWEDENYPMLTPEESIALNPAPKMGSELHLTESIMRGSHQPRHHSKKKKGRKNQKKVAFGEDTEVQHSIIRELLEHPTTSEDDQEEKATGALDKLDFEDLTGEEAEAEREREEPVDPEFYKSKVKALSEWNNITNMDQFLELVYNYYINRGHGPLILHDISNLAKLGFMIIFSTVLAYFVDWSFVYRPATSANHPKLWEVLSVANFFRQISFFGIICITVFGGYWWIQCLRFYNRLPLYDQVSRFYRHLLEIEDKEFGDTVDFADICDAIMKLHDKNKIVGDSLDARDICNRIMRKDNYMIALFNRDLLHLNDGLPKFMGSNATLLTRILEWNIVFCLLGYVFEGERSSIRAAFLKTTQRDRLATELRKRFQLLAIINFLLTPFLLVFIGVYFLFRYGEELYRKPTSVTDRQYSTWSHWTLREFNELEHLFEKRLAASHEKAMKYIESFPAPRCTAAVKFVSFVAGSIVLVLLIMTVVNEDLLMHFELTEGKSVIWFLGFFGALLTISRALIPNPRAQYFDKVGLIEEVSAHLHYSPESWKRHPESTSVRQELKELFPTRYQLFIREIIGLFLNPYILYYSLPKNAEELVEFFREFSVQVDGLGYVCSFALFDFERHGDMKLLEQLEQGAGDENVLAQRRLQPIEDSYLQSKNGKMEKSLLNFKVNNPRWIPDANTNKFIDNLSGFLDKSAAQLAKSIQTKKSKRSSLILSRLSLAFGGEAFKDDEREKGEVEVVEDSLYIPPKTGEDKKERIASSIISVLDQYRHDSE